MRKSNVELDRLYFRTATTNNWHKLLHEDALKEIIISSLKHLTAERKNRSVYFCDNAKSSSFYLATSRNDGKEKPHTSFLKYTAHSFKKHLQINNVQLLTLYAGDATNKRYVLERKVIKIRKIY